MKDSVHIWIQKCSTCAQNMKPRKTPKAPLGNMSVGAPLDRIGIDLLGPLPETPRDNKFILALQDYFTKWVEIYAIPDATAETCAEKIVNEFISRFGIPLSIHTDQGNMFEADLFQECCIILQTEKTRSSPRHPSGNGMIQRFNQTLIQMIKSFINGKQNLWDI